MARRVFLGIDCGTQSTKAVLVDADSLAVVAVGRGAHDLIEAADGTREQQPAWWIEALIAATREALAAAGPVEIAGVGVSGQQHGLVCLDATQQPIRAAKLWNDTTTGPDCAWLTRKLGGLEAVLALTGNAFVPGYTAPKISWLHRSEPETYSATRQMCLPHDYINLWLTGEYATEPGDASGTGYFDIRTLSYSQQVLALLDGERDWAATLPPVVPSLSTVGRLRPAAAEALGIAPGAPVSGGGGDNACAAIGIGAVSEGPVVVSLGTSGTAFTYRNAPAVDPLGEVCGFCSSTGGWLPLSCTLNCTGVTEWVRRLFGLDHAGIEAALAATQPGADGLSFLPYLDGERTPNLPDAAGRFHGLRTGHDRDQIVRAVLEGVSFGLAYQLEALRRTGVAPTRITLVGGGAASTAWGQLLADVLQLPVGRPEITEAAASGGALQSRWVVDGQAPPQPLLSATWEPRSSTLLDEAAQRVAAMRQQLHTTAGA
ncbi:MAG: xylulokinase [Chloroflexota bacterium]